MKTIDSSANKTVRAEKYRGLVQYYLGHVLIYLGLLTVALVVVWLVVKANRLYTAYRHTRQHLAALEAFALDEKSGSNSLLQLARIEADLQGQAQGFETLYQESSAFLPLTPYLGWVPGYGGDLEALPHLLIAGRNVSRAAVILFDSVTPALQPEKTLPDVVLALAQAEPKLREANSLLKQAEAHLNFVEVERLSPGLAAQVSPLKQYLPRAISGVQFAGTLPVLLGTKAPRTYLILTQNADELRPSGGYINTAGHIIFDRGQIVEFVMQDSYAVDRLSDEYPYPPQPLYQYMAADYWVLRDAGWSPDFPTTARTALALYALGQGISADGVIAFDQQALPALVQALEPLTVDGEQVTQANVIELMRRHWAPEPAQSFDREWWLQRKSFMVALAEVIRQRFEQDLASINLVMLSQGLQQAVSEKHLLIYVPDAKADSFLTGRNWAGALSPVKGDYLMIADANLGFNKASAAVERHLDYQIALAADGSAQARARLVYHHQAPRRLNQCSKTLRYDPVYEQNIARCYWNYHRLIVPAGAELISGPSIVVAGQYLLRGQSTSGQIDVAPIGADKISWGQLFLLAPQESLSLDYVYRLPAGTARPNADQWQYRLFLQKQPGTLAPPVTVEITLPAGAQFGHSHPEPVNQAGAVISYSFNLQTDQTIDLSYHFP